MNCSHANQRLSGDGIAALPRMNFIIMICIKFTLHRTAIPLPESLDSPDCDYKWLQIYSNYNIEEYVHFFLKNVPVMQESNGIYLI